MTRVALDRMSQTDWDELVGTIYETAFRPESWGETLLRIGRPINAHAAQMVVVARDVADSYESIIVGLDNQAAQREFEELIERGVHVRANAGSRIPQLTTITDHDHTTESEMKRHPFYQEHAYPHDIPYYGATVVTKSRDTFIASVIMRSSKAGHLSGEEVAYLNRLGPHIRRSLELSFRLPREGLINGVMSTLEGMSCGGILVDGRSSIVAMNDKASHLLKLDDGISECGSHLHLFDRAANRALRKELLLALGYKSSASAVGSGCVQAKRRSEKAPYSLYVTPVRRRRTTLFRQRYAIILLIDPEQEFIFPEGFLKDAFDLTPAESSVATLLVAGHTLGEIAQYRGSTVETVRSQLKKVFDKADCTHQSELVSKLAANLSVRLGCFNGKGSE